MRCRVLETPACMLVHKPAARSVQGRMHLYGDDMPSWPLCSRYSQAKTYHEYGTRCQVLCSL